MDIAALFTTAFVVGLSGAMMPGPLLTLTLVATAERGFKAGPQMVLGHAILELSLLAALLAGAVNFLLRPASTTIIALAGGAFLIYLGFSMISDVWTGKLHAIDTPANGNGAGPVTMHPVISGLLVSVSNPFWTIWWATIGLSYLTLSLKSGLIGVGAFFSGHILSDLLWYSLIALAVSKGKGLLSPRIYQGLLTGCGFFMLGMGVYFFYTGAMGLPVLV